MKLPLSVENALMVWAMMAKLAGPEEAERAAREEEEQERRNEERAPLIAKLTGLDVAEVRDALARRLTPNEIWQMAKVRGQLSGAPPGAPRMRLVR